MTVEPNRAMWPPRTVVVPLDGSTVAQAALPTAHHLAAAFHAKVERVTVADGGAGPIGPVDVVLDGDPVGSILGHVEQLDAPLLVLSAHGHSGWTKRLAGSVAERIIRTSSAPVVVVGPHVDRSRPLLAPRTLLVAVGPPPVPPRLIPAAAQWATHLRASVVLAHVAAPERGKAATRDAADGTSSGDGPSASTAVPDLEAAAAQLTAAGVAEVRVESITGKHRTRALVGLADAQPPPVLIVAQAHEQADVDLGDQITYKLLRHSQWPILATVGRVTQARADGHAAT